MNKLAKRLLSEAKKEMGTGNDAEVARRALQLAEVRCTESMLAQGEIVEHIVVLGLHEQEGHTLSQFLLKAGLSVTKASHLISIATVIKPFCQEHGLVLDEALTPEHYGKLREAIPNLRGAIEAADVKEVKHILSLVLKASDRGVVRKRLHGQPAKLGYGIMVDVSDSEVVLAVKLTGDPDKFTREMSELLDLNNGGDRTEFIRSLTGALASILK